MCVITVVVLLYAGLLSLFIAHLVGRIVSGVWVSASFQINPGLMGRLGSEVWVSVSLRMFVCPVMFLPSCLPSPVPERSFLCPVSPVVF